jgi:hypothetical protein
MNGNEEKRGFQLNRTTTSSTSFFQYETLQAVQHCA